MNIVSCYLCFCDTLPFPSFACVLTCTMGYSISLKQLVVLAGFSPTEHQHYVLTCYITYPLLAEPNAKGVRYCLLKPWASLVVTGGRMRAQKLALAQALRLITQHYCFATGVEGLPYTLAPDHGLDRSRMRENPATKTRLCSAQVEPSNTKVVSIMSTGQYT